MKKTICLLIGILSVASFATKADAVVSLAIGDIYYLGSIETGVPPGSNEINWVNEVIAGTLGATFASTNPAGQTLFRSTRTFGGATLSPATNDDKIDNSNDRTVGANTAYALGKYGNATGQPGETGSKSHIWYVGGIDVGETLDLDSARGGLSHTTLFDGTRTEESMPEGGATLSLLGLSLIGMIFARRIRRK